MKISDLLKATRDGIEPWATTQTGSVEIAFDINHLFALLSIKPGGFRVAILWEGQEKRGQIEEASMVDDTCKVCISFGRPMKLEMGNALVNGAEGSAPFCDLVEGLRDTLRAICYDPESSESIVDYKRARPLVDINPNFLLVGFFIEFSLGNILPAPATDNE